MSPEEKEEYLKQKRLEAKEKIREKMKEKQKELRKIKKQQNMVSGILFSVIC